MRGKFRGIPGGALLLSSCGGTAPAPASSAPPISAAAKQSAAAPASASAKPAASAAASAAAKPAACASTGAAGSKEGPSITFKFATGFPPTDFSAQGIQHWTELVGERTGGRIKFQMFWSSSLLNTTQLFQGIRDGLADFGNPASSFLSGQVPDVAHLEVPFAYPLDNEHTLPFYREMEPLVDEVYNASGKQRVVFAENATSTIPAEVTCKNKFLDSAQAWNGALVRTAGKWQAAVVERWGGKPVVLDLSEAYSGIQRGTADCLLFTYSLLDSFKMYEVAKYVTRIDHSVNFTTITANADAWGKLPASDQQILKQAGRETQDWLTGRRTELVDQTLAKLKQNGMNFCVPSQQEFQRLRSATDPVLAEIAKLQTDKGRAMQEVAKKYRDMVKTLGPAQGDMTPCPAK
jgi:TRAP-type C4-dicarboxylate transport system substrate-binding protein